MVHACIMGTCGVAKRPTVHVTRGGRGACINGTAYVLEPRESPREGTGGGTLLQKAHAAKRKTALHSSSRFWVASFFSCIAVIPSSSSSTPHPTTKPPAAVLYSRPKNLHFTETERAKRELQQQLSFFLHPHSSMLLLLLCFCGRAGALIWCTGDNDQLDKATCGVCVCVCGLAGTMPRSPLSRSLCGGRQGAGFLPTFNARSG